MMRTTLPGVVIALMLGATAFAKGRTIKLVVTGPGLSAPLEITTPNAIAPNVWAGNFYNVQAAAPDDSWPRYVVSFYAVVGHEGVSRCYVVTYARDPRTGNAVVYLPGRGEAGYKLNVGSILLGIEGTWRVADRSWSDAVAAALPRR